MAWRIHDQVVRGEVDCRVKGKVTGSIWLAGRLDPLVLDLEGSPWSDMSGCLLQFENPTPVEGNHEGLVSQQRGACGDLTASRKVKVPTVPINDWAEQHPSEPIPFRWATSIYLEWFSDVNGRVVIEASGYNVSISEPLWRATPEEEAMQRHRSVEAMTQWMTRVLESENPEDPRPSQENDAAITEMVESVLHVQELKHEVERVTGGQVMAGSTGHLPAQVEEQFWQNVLAFETAPRVCRKQMLASLGVQTPAPTLLSDEDLSAVLWQVITGLARHRQYLENTNHLSDRELYTLLVEEVLEQETEMFPPESRWNCHISIADYGGPDGHDATSLYLRYYADAAERQRWAADFPEDELPPQESPICDRDRHLPKPESIEP